MMLLYYFNNTLVCQKFNGNKNTMWRQFVKINWKNFPKVVRHLEMVLREYKQLYIWQSCVHKSEKLLRIYIIYYIIFPSAKLLWKHFIIYNKIFEKTLFSFSKNASLQINVIFDTLFSFWFGFYIYLVFILLENKNAMHLKSIWNVLYWNL